ncbi:MAG TPA: hypothetical protein ENH15_02790 [Actinobacteria bacterium]|nr:hypothetical protein [Actinomycetota bacterium]
MQQILRNTAFTMEVRVYQGSTLTDLAADPTVAVVDDQGTVVSAGAVTKPGGTTGTYQATIAAVTALTTLTATWSGTLVGNPITIETTYEVVGTHLFSLADLKAVSGLSAETDGRLAAARLAVCDEFGSWCGIDFIPRPRYDILDGSGTDTLWLSRSRPTALVAVEIDGVAQSLVDMDLYEYGALKVAGSWTPGNRNTEVFYEAGYDRPPSDVARVAIIRAADQILGDSNTISSRAMGSTNEFGNIRFASYKPTGLPDVDAVLERYRRPQVR